MDNGKWIKGIWYSILFLNPTILWNQTKTFNHAINFLWNDPLNWTPIGVPAIIDSVILPTGVINISAGFDAVAKYVKIEADAEVVIERIINSVGTLTVKNSDGIAIQNNGILTNRGEIEISNCLIGLNNDGCIFNQNTGVVKIDSSTSNSISNRDSIFNLGYLSLTYLIGPSAYCIYNEGYIHNTGYILIDSVGSSAIRLNTGLGQLINEDTLEIRNFNLISTIQNECIEVTNGLLNNQHDGVILIENPQTSSNGITISTAVVENYGIIKIRNMYGHGIIVSNDGILRNEQLIKIQDLSLTALVINETGTFFQRPSGELVIKNITGDPLVIDSLTVVDIEGILDVKN